jgi:hypothetical protein
MTPQDDANRDDARDATWQPDLFGPGAESLLKQRPLFAGGMDRGRKLAPARPDQPDLPFDECGNCAP